MAVGSGITTELRPVRGVRLAVASAGIKTPGKQDLVLVELAAGSELAAVFTRNRFCAAPVHIARDHVARYARSDRREPVALLINTGNANAGTGEQGLNDARACCEATADALNLRASSIIPFSTGVIGEYLPLDRMRRAIPSLAASLGDADWYTAARSILTTDTRAKGHSVTVEIDDSPVTITGMSKGSGMICPNMATMLGFVCTDAAVSSADLHALLQTATEKTFNRISVDGDTSTNDACVLAATGESGVSLSPESAGWSEFAAAIEAVMHELAQQIIRDGEGVTRVMAVRVTEAASVQEALDVAYTIAHSPLVKTALAAGDANWGRLLAAVGRAPLDDLDINRVTLAVDDVPVVAGGQRHPAYTEERGAAVFAREELTVTVGLGRGDTTETVWTTDLSHEYVSINADYRT